MEQVNVDPTPHEIAKTIEHTLLKPAATAEQVERLCEEAVKFGFAGVCVHPCRLPVVQRVLGDKPIARVTVIGFPLGASTTAAKVEETRNALNLGATEIDMVVNLGWLMDGDHDRVADDVRAVVEEAKDVPVKVILETAALDEAQVRPAAELAVGAGATYLKTSTGFGPGGATVDAVRILREVAGHRARVKASGGIRDAAAARAMLAAGADRLGTSASVAIVGG